MRKSYTGDELRFFAPAPGDRWNGPDTYWLTVGDTPGRRIVQQDTPPDSAPQRTTGVEAGIWRSRTISDSTLLGPDGDHWFADELRSSPGQEADPIALPIAPTLSRTAGPVTLTISGSASTAGAHELAITAGSATASVRWEGTGDWTETITLDTEATSATSALLPGVAVDGVLIDRVQWTRRARCTSRWAQLGRPSAAWPGSGATSLRT